MGSEGRSALSALEAAYTDRLARVRAGAESGTGIIGFVGSDVPVEVLEAAGAAAYQLHGSAGAIAPEAIEMLGASVDSWAPSMLDLILRRAFGPLTGIVVGRDCQSSMYLFYALRELRRLDAHLGIPPVHLLDILHRPTAHTLGYNTCRITQLMDQVLPDWLARDPLAATELGQAIRARRRVRELLGYVEELRRQPEPRLTGTQALRIHGAVRSIAPAEAAALLEALLSGADGLAPVTPTIRLFVTGSNQDTDAAYVALEADGAVIDGEDHDWGFTGGYDAPSDDVAGLAAALRDRGPAAPSSSMARRATSTAAAATRCAADHVLAYVRTGDEAPSWDYPVQRARLAEHGITTTLLAEQPYLPDEPRLREAVAAARHNARTGSPR